ncbi:hypothetical protein [Oceanivirga miroungae]|uniref:Uncharacterized protein n=1 Tax=Oceanivirga miroungae TaxID=1130046 RepID=A0A6I8MC47_9FUSO|nr:hypothetical protein [Oceanivirga miroungae]VWL85007.1 hypothetical protein OMES3154_00279 [Oceanivirga miroungae]
MLKRVLVIVLILLSNLVFSQDFGKEIIKRQEIIKKAFDENLFYDEGVVYADVLEADYFLEILNDSKLNLKGNVGVLVFPDLDKLDKYLISASKKLKGIKIYLLDKKTNAYKMENRSFEELKNKNKYIEISNIKFIIISSEDKIINDIYLNSLIEKDMMNNVIYKKMGINFGGEYNEF